MVLALTYILVPEETLKAQAQAITELYGEATVENAIKAYHDGILGQWETNHLTDYMQYSVELPAVDEIEKDDALDEYLAAQDAAIAYWEDTRH